MTHVVKYSIEGGVAVGSTSSAVKNRWNAKTYDRIGITIPKGYGEQLKEYCEKQGKTVNVVVMDEIKKRMEKGK